MQLRLISEAGYGRTYSFDYQNAQTDKRPRLLLLGKWRHPTTRNILLAGINLNYLSDDQLAAVRQNLKQIVAPRNLKSRYWKGKQLVPDVFEMAYRTYDKDYVGSITKDTLKFWPSDAALEKAEKQAQDAEAKKKEADIKKAAPAAPGAPAVPGAPTPAAAPTPGAEAPMPGAEPGAAAAPVPGKEPTEPKGELPGPGAPAPAPAAPATTAAAPTPRQKRLKQPKPAEPVGPEPAGTKPSSAQKRKKQAQQIEKAIQRTEPQPKPEPPPEIGGAVNMFHKPK